MNDDATLPSPPSPTGDKPLPAALGELKKPRNYEVGDTHARGGMGAILCAKDLNINRTVAMKVMLPDQTDSAELASRFVDEAKITGQLEHPNIVPVHELGVDEQNRPFYTMKFVMGVTLKQVLDEIKQGKPEALTRYSLAHLLTIFQKTCDAVAFAHARGVVHRDLKPENIMLGEYGEVLVLDWGLAKQLGTDETASGRVSEIADSGRTMAGTIMGTPQFMAPEQAEGQIDRIDARTDIYALGGILYNLLTLQPPITGNTTNEVLEKVRTGQITPPSAVGRVPSRGDDSPTPSQGTRPTTHIPDSLSAVAMKAMALRREDRYQSVKELQLDIEAYQNGFATEAENASLMKQILLLIQRHKREFTVGFAALFILVAMGVWFVINLRASERVARAAEAVAVEEKEATRQALATTALALAESAFREQDGAAMQAALNEVPDDLRDSNWNYLLEKSDTSLATIRSRSTGYITRAAPHPKQPGVFAIAGADHWVSLVEVRTGAKLLEFQPGFKDKSSKVYHLAFSPDGERLAIGRRGIGGIVIHSARDGKKLAEWETANTDALQFSPDGRQLLEVVYAKQINLWDAATGRLLWTQPGGSYSLHATLDPSGQMILVSFGNHLKLLKAQDGSLLRQLPNARYPIFSMAIRSDGARALIGDGNGFVRCLDLRDGRILYEIRANDRYILDLAYTPEGGRFVTLATLSGERQSLQVWDAASGKLLQPLLGGSGKFNCLSVHPASGEIVVAGEVTKAWNLTGQQEKRRLICSGSSRTIAFWKTDDWIFAPYYMADIELLDLQTTDSIKRPIWKPEALLYRLVSVSANGRFAAVGNPKGQIHFLRLNGPTVEEVRAFQLKDQLDQMELSPTGDRLWTGKGVVDPATGTELLRLDLKGIRILSVRARWLNNTELIGSVVTKAPRGQPRSEEQLIVWDAATGQRLRTVTHRSVIHAFAVAPDGKTVAEAGADKMVRLRDAATLEVKEEFRAHDGPIMALAFHPTQPILATASDDLIIKLWNLDTGRLLDELRGLLGAPNDLVFSPSGKRLACFSQLDGSTRIWEPVSLNPDASAKVNAGGWEDLLAPLKRDDVAKKGNGWRLNNGALLSSNNEYAAIALPGNVAQSSYQVRVKLRQMKPENAFEVILPVADRQVAFKLDGYPKDGFFTSLFIVKGEGRNAPGTLKGKQVRDSDQHELELTVRLEAANASIEARLDGQPLYQWSGPVTALSLYSKWPVFPPGTLAIGAHKADWVVYAVKVKEGK